MTFHRPGQHTKVVILRANKCFRGGERRHHVFVDSAGAEPNPYVAQLVVFFTCEFLGEVKKLAFVRWYKAFGVVNKHTGCRTVKPETRLHVPAANEGGGRSRQVWGGADMPGISSVYLYHRHCICELP